MDSLKVSLVQYNITWELPEKNFEKIRELTSTLDPTDLIVLPEMFNTGFCVREPQHAEDMSGRSVQFLQELSKKHRAGVAASLMIRVGDKLLNRFVLVEGNEVLGSYDKVHLFKLSGEHEHFASGAGKVDLEFRGFKIRPIICYDLRFPYISFNSSEYDILLLVANWPNLRIEHWEALITARAIENQAYVVGVNRVGIDPFGVEYPGHSEVRNPAGDLMLRFTGEHARTLVLEKQFIHDYRERFPFMEDQRKPPAFEAFQIK